MGIFKAPCKKPRWAVQFRRWAEKRSHGMPEAADAFLCINEHIDGTHTTIRNRTTRHVPGIDDPDDPSTHQSFLVEDLSNTRHYI